MTQEQILGKIAALEVIAAQILTFHLTNNLDKETILASLRENLSALKGDLRGEAESSFLECANRVYELGNARALDVER